MTCIFIIFILYCLFSAKYKNPFSKDFHDDFLSRESTQMINGIFVFLVFMSHFSSYVDDFFKVDSVYLVFNKYLGQCVVSTFLFYSGYGIAEQLKKNRLSYTKKLVTQRFFSLWFKFILCVFLYIILAFAMGKSLTIKQILLSFVALDSVGNSAWYIFYMLFMYVSVFLSFRFLNNKKLCLLILFLITVIYTIILFFAKNDSPAYYLVSFVLPVGILFSYYKKQVIIFLKSHYILILSVLFFLYIVSFLFRHFFHLEGWAYSFTAICFMAIILMMTLKIQFNNFILRFLGTHVFEIYILQRLPMIALTPLYKSLDKGEGYIFFLISCIGGTLILAIFAKIIFRKFRI